MKKYNLLVVLTLLFIFSITGCSKKEPVESTEDFGTIEESTEQETTQDIFAVENPNIEGYEIRESTSASHETEKEREITFTAPTETTVAKENLTDEELEEVLVMEDTFTHPITGEFCNVTEMNNVYNMMYEAKELWKSEFDAGRVSKEVVTKYFNYVYKAVDDAAREKTIQEILSPNLKVTVIEPESWPLEEEEIVSEESLSEEDAKLDSEELQQLMKDNDSIVSQRWSNVGGSNIKTEVDDLITDTSRVTTGDLSPYNPN